MTSNQQRETILLKANLTRKDIQLLTEYNSRVVGRIFNEIKEKILEKLRKEDPGFNFYNNKYIPTIHALPYLKRFGIDKETIITNAKIERLKYAQ